MHWPRRRRGGICATHLRRCHQGVEFRARGRRVGKACQQPALVHERGYTGWPDTPLLRQPQQVVPRSGVGVHGSQPHPHIGVTGRPLRQKGFGVGAVGAAIAHEHLQRMVWRVRARGLPSASPVRYRHPSHSSRAANRALSYRGLRPWPCGGRVVLEPSFSPLGSTPQPDRRNCQTAQRVSYPRKHYL